MAEIYAFDQFKSNKVKIQFYVQENSSERVAFNYGLCTTRLEESYAIFSSVFPGAGFC